MGVCRGVCGGCRGGRAAELGVRVFPGWGGRQWRRWFPLLVLGGGVGGVVLAVNSCPVGGGGGEGGGGDGELFLRVGGGGCRVLRLSGRKPFCYTVFWLSGQFFLLSCSVVLCVVGYCPVLALCRSVVL